LTKFLVFDKVIAISRWSTFWDTVYTQETCCVVPATHIIYHILYHKHLLYGDDQPELIGASHD